MEGGFIIAVIVVIGVILILSSTFSKKAVIIRKLRKTPNKKIKDFQNGDFAKIVGEVELTEELLIAPLSGRPCTYYYIIVEEKVSTGKSSRWSTLIEEEITNNFIIREDDNIALIDTEFVKSYLVPDRDYSSGFLNDATSNLEEYLNDHGYESTGFFGMNKTIRYKEGIIEPGEEVAVAGVGEWTEESYEFPNKKILKITAQREHLVFLSDDPSAMNVVEEKPDVQVKKNIDIPKRSIDVPKRKERTNKSERKSRYVKDYK